MERTEIKQWTLTHFVNKEKTHTWMAYQQRVFEGMLKGYGGKVKHGQFLKDSACDEIKTETGCDKKTRKGHEVDGGIIVLPENLHLKGCLTIFELEKQSDPLVYPAGLLWCYWCDTYTGIPVSTVEMDMPGLYPINRLPFHLMVPGDEHFIPLMFKENEFFKGVLVRSLDKKTFFYHDIKPCTIDDLVI